MGKKKTNNVGDMIFVDSVYRPSTGSFGKPSVIKDNRYVVKNWFNCREIWHKNNVKCAGFDFACGFDAALLG